MGVVIKVLECATASGLLYLIGDLLIMPISPVVVFFEKRGYSYEDILNKGHNLALASWFIGFIILIVFTFK